LLLQTRKKPFLQTIWTSTCHILWSWSLSFFQTCFKCIHKENSYRRLKTRMGMSSSANESSRFHCIVNYGTYYIYDVTHDVLDDKNNYDGFYSFICLGFTLSHHLLCSLCVKK
jgi:hypothetical protein